MNEAIERIEKLIEVVKETRAETTGMTFILHELKRILEILKPKEDTPEELGEIILASNRRYYDLCEDDSF